MDSTGSQAMEKAQAAFKMRLEGTGMEVRRLQLPQKAGEGQHAVLRFDLFHTDEGKLRKLAAQLPAREHGMEISQEESGPNRLNVTVSGPRQVLTLLHALLSNYHERDT